jgi:hypothetical protein
MAFRCCRRSQCVRCTQWPGRYEPPDGSIGWVNLVARHALLQIAEPPARKRSCLHQIVLAASSSEPPNERGVGATSSRSLATATREASHRGTRRGREENDVDLALGREAVEDGRATLKTSTPPAAGRPTDRGGSLPAPGPTSHCSVALTVVTVLDSAPTNSTLSAPVRALMAR